MIKIFNKNICDLCGNKIKHYNKIHIYTLYKNGHYHNAIGNYQICSNKKCKNNQLFIQYDMGEGC